jgi:hypothetical protein
MMRFKKLARRCDPGDPCKKMATDVAAAILLPRFEVNYPSMTFFHLL